MTEPIFPKLRIGSRLGPYRLIELIGRGGMGEVYQAERADDHYRSRVAIKLVRVDHDASRLAWRFRSERQILAQLEHPNIARLIDGGVTDDGLPWLAMEYVDGVPIDEAAKGKSLGARLALFVRAADAVQYAHSRMIAHADLKPSNILVGGDGRLKLLDFGISQLIDGDREQAAAGAVTRDYASPQRLAGAGPSVSDDVYALGCTFAAMLDGTSDPELAAIVARARHPDEAARYGSAAELIADLDRWRARLPVVALPSTFRYRAGKFVERHRWGVAATGVALALLSAASLIATINYVRAEASRARAEARFSEVRDLSHFMLFDLYDTLARRPGTVPERAQLAATSARYLDRLNISGESRIDLRLETARSYRRLAEIQGVAALSNLGQPEAASRSLGRALGLLRAILAEQPDNVDALTELGWVQLNRWSLIGNASSVQIFADAREALLRANRLQPGNAAARLGLLASMQGEAYDLIWTQNKAAAAIPLMRRAIADVRAARWSAELAPRAAALEIGLLNQLGDATYYAGDIPGSLPIYREADGLIDRRIAAEGPTPELIVAKGGSAFNVGGTLSDMSGHEAEALAIVRQTIGALRALLAAGPDASAEKRLLVLYGQEAAVLENMGQIREALVPLNAGIALRDARLAAAPGDPQRMRDLAIGLIPQARILGLAGSKQQGCAAATRNMALWRQIKARGDLSAHDAAQEIPKTEALRKKLCAA